MAIEITPRRRIKSPVWAITLSVFCLILLSALIASYFYLNSSTKKINLEIKEKETASAATPEEKALEDNLSLAKDKISAFSGLILKHREPANIFGFLENNCFPNIQFYNFDFAADKNTVGLSGTTDDFISLEQQILIFRKDSLVKKVELSKISIGKEGVVDFGLILIFDPEMLK